MFVGQSKPFARGIDKLCTSLAVRLMRPGNFRNAFADEGMCDDELRFAVVALLRDVQRIEKLLHVLAVDLLDIESVRLKTPSSVLALCLLCRGIQRDRIGIIDDNQIIETEMCCESARFRCNAFLHVTIASQANNMLVEDPVLRGVETGGRHFGGYRYSGGIANALAKRPGRTFNSGRFRKFRMSRRLAVQLPEAFDFR